MTDELFEQTGRCRECGRKGNRMELIRNEGLCWKCIKKEIQGEEDEKTDCLKCRSFNHCRILKITNYTEITECQEYVPMEDVK